MTFKILQDLNIILIVNFCVLFIIVALTHSYGAVHWYATITCVQS